MKYNCRLTRTASNSLAVGALYADATAPRLSVVERFLFSAIAGTLADDAHRVQVQRSTTAPTGGTTGPITAFDEDGQAAVNDAMEGPSGNGTLTANAFLLDQSVHVRSRLDLYLPPGSEWRIAATAGHGVHVMTPSGSTSLAVVANFHFEE